MPQQTAFSAFQSTPSRGPLPALTAPTVADLQSEFVSVGKGHLPAGYPVAAGSMLVPVSVLKAVAWTESKWRQFDSSHRPLVSPDGGYGLMQVTSGMRDGTLPSTVRSAIANNSFYNLAFGAQSLADKLLHTPSIGNGDPAILEHWYYALWAYNAWGWTNNPANPRFTRQGTPSTSPGAFPYQERVLYWLANPPLGPNQAPLWTAITVLPPDSTQIGTSAVSLPEPAILHKDVASPYPEVSLSAHSSARYVADVTIPDGTVLQPGQHYRKTWRLQNNGSLSWGTGYSLAAVGGAPQPGPSSTTVRLTPPLAETDISVDLVAPALPGGYRQMWQMKDDTGRAFGPTVWVAIRVAPGTSTLASPLPKETIPAPALPTAGPSGGGLELSRAALVQPAGTGDAAVYTGDLSVPDGTVFTPGAHFVKSWRLTNVGSTTWRAGYTWRFEAGTLLSASVSVPVPLTYPGGSAVISVPMTAPTTAGAYTSFWQMANGTGKAFPHQAWVKIVVRLNSGAAPTITPPQSSPTRGTRPTVPLPSATPLASTTGAVPPTKQATQTVPGGDGQLVGSPWVGALDNRIYFAAGSTAAGMRENLQVYYPGSGLAHVRVTLYRPDAAQRTLQFTLRGGNRRLLALNQLAPGTGLATAVESDRRVVAERIQTSRAGLMASPGAARTARVWTFPSVSPGGPPIQELALFNPHDVPVAIQGHIGIVTGGCCTADFIFSVPPLSQYIYRLGSAGIKQGPLTLRATNAIAAERVTVAYDATAMAAVPGTVTTSKHWYLPDIRGGAGAYVSLYNPTRAGITATVRSSLSTGNGPWLQQNIPPQTEVRVSFASLPAALVSAEVDATGPIVAGEVWHLSGGSPAAAIGGTARGTHWTLVCGGRGTSDTLSVFNPSAVASTVIVRVAGYRRQATWNVTIPPHGRYSRLLDPLVPEGGATLTVDSSQPVSVEHVLISNNATAIAPATLLNAG